MCFSHHLQFFTSILEFIPVVKLYVTWFSECIDFPILSPSSRFPANCNERSEYENHAAVQDVTCLSLRDTMGFGSLKFFPVERDELQGACWVGHATFLFLTEECVMSQKNLCERENIWFSVTTMCAARSVRLDREPIIFPSSGPTYLSQ